MNSLHSTVLENQVRRYREVLYNFCLKIQDDSQLTQEERGRITSHLLNVNWELKYLEDEIHNGY